MTPRPATDATQPPAPNDRRSVRRQETKDEILAAAWDLVRQEGLAGLALRDLGKRVGMKAQSLYSYFDSKLEIYDAMFHQGYLAFVAELDRMKADVDQEPTELLRGMAHGFFEFCTSDPVRYQLLFQRTIPGFEPSEESYAVAQDAYAVMTTSLADIGITDPAAIDLWTALLTGLADQQISNDPGGDRWKRLVDSGVEMFLATNAPALLQPSPEGNQT